MVAFLGFYLVLEYKVGPKSKRVEIDADQKVARIAVRQYTHPSVEDEKHYPFSAMTRVRQYKNKRGKELGIDIGLSLEHVEDSLFIEQRFFRALAKRVPDTTAYLKEMFGTIPVEIEIFPAKKKRASKV